MPSIAFNNIVKKFGALTVIENLNLSIGDGEFLVLLGPSGCGKTTLLNLLAGLLEIDDGEILIDERDVSYLDPKDRGLAMVFQSYALYPTKTVRGNMNFGLSSRGISRDEASQRIAWAAKLLQIEHLLDRKPSQLSGGQRQRVAIGRALVRKPEVFLFDEPLSNLDAKLRMEMRTEIKRLHQMLKTTVVYVTHDQIEAMTLASRIAVMRDGRIEQLGTPEEIYNHPATLYVATFVGAPPMNLLKATVRDGRLALSGSDASLPLPARFRETAGNGRDLILGIRPEALRTDGTGPSIEAILEVAELTGPELVVTALAGNQRLMACLPPRTPIRDNEKLTLFFDEEAMHLFDPQTGLSCGR
jgi:multiple sugar transport system ATP-binding protein